MRVVLVSLGSRDRYGGFDRALLGVAYVHASVEADPALARRVAVVHRVHDAELTAPGDVVDDVLAADPDVVGFGCYVWNTPMALSICAELKRRRPRVRTVIGGPDAETLVRDGMGRHPAVDVAVVGEGEATFREILAHLLDGAPALSAVAGVAFHAGGADVVTPQRAPLAELDALPSPYLGGQLAPSRGCYLETFRGCPYTCSFCAWGDRKARYFSLDRVRAELDSLNRPDVTAVMFVDSIFNLNRPRAHAILEHVLATDFQPWIWLELYPRLIDERTLELLRRIGKAYVGVGIQTTNPVAMEAVRRVWDPDEVARLLDGVVTQQDPCIALEFIMGLPGDDLPHFVETVNWAFDRAPGAMVCSHLHVLPGSDLLRDASALGLDFDASLRNRLVESPTMAPGEVRTGHRMAGWIDRWQGLFGRLGALSGRPVGNLVLDWVGALEREGLGEVADAYLALHVTPAGVEQLLAALERFVAALGVGPDPAGLAARLGALQRYMIARLYLVGEGWCHFEGLDVAGIRYTSQGRVEAPWRGERAPGAAAAAVADGALRFTGAAAVLEFPFDPEELLTKRDVAGCLSVPAVTARYFIFARPDNGASRACAVSADEARHIDAIARGTPCEHLPAAARRIAAGLLAAGLLTPLDADAATHASNGAGAAASTAGKAARAR